MIKQVGGRRGAGPGGLTPEERQARKRKAQSQSKAAGEAQDANTPISPKGSTDPKQSAEKAGRHAVKPAHGKGSIMSKVR